MVEDARPLLNRAIELVDEVRPQSLRLRVRGTILMSIKLFDEVPIQGCYPEFHDFRYGTLVYLTSSREVRDQWQ